ncbi:phospholipase D delta-like isoform X2 [Telopea speciosissima]|uniref:phospholipase D delta-like isoform X2 n=1 Tax=Telopea speciosissima TaxID=54955 RepID=UPI001CC3FCA0|nr:phospholipase D delta-like isoform X2 [Telopea speciosissima]
MAGESDNVKKTVGEGKGVHEKSVFLHGNLDVWIKEARSLPNMDLASERMRKCFTMFGACISPFARELRKNLRQVITSDPYVSVCLAGATVAQTRVIANSEYPSWEEHFYVPVAHPISKVEFQVKDNDVLGAQLIGVVDISVEKILQGDKIDGWFPIVGPYASPLKPYPELHLSLQFKTVRDDPLYKDGVGAGPDYSGVPGTYFPLRKGSNVTLYQDAHVPDDMLPEILLDGGKIFQQGKCWEDICHAILEAHHLIYIVGWSIYHPVKLVREPTRPLSTGGELSLGELLKYKSQEGVRVLMMVWDDKTSHDTFLLKTEGVMETHDEETRKFFKHSSVHCVLSPRYASNKLSIIKQQVVGTLFTHHQKCIILDTQATGNNRKITAFIGGLDLCDGRYDTPQHRLFSDLDSVFANDFHNPTFPSRARGPRQPWHDLHCKIEGPAAHDIMTNFEQRWRKTTKWKKFGIKKVTLWHDDAMLKLERISWILTPSTSAPDGDHNIWVSEEGDPENWHVQIFRSIDSGSVKGFPKVVQEAEAQNLICGKNLKIDKSIHSAYVKAIRSAQHFIYIENQFFLGSSYYWPSYKNAGADNLVPMEIALKIASKIAVNERFSVYIVIPMWPEGVPTSAAMQEILYWQSQTMEMMYRIVGQALEKAGLANQYHPQDYLNFYCLGKREDGAPEGSAQTNPSSENSALVYGYRMSLWAEHLGILEECFREPQTLDCVMCVNKLAQRNWKSYVSVENNNEMKGHLMSYPVKVSRDGKVGPMPGYESFPDVGGKILGAPTNLPDALTT